ncbi:MAG: hypothetical protein FWH21_06095, partial [Kiritimatiellaeota bacterium]|nr:hypothetical protein [Kiritimatiellota bacterium]
EDANYVFLTLSTAQTNFVASRGEYQNFNAWNVGDAGANQFTDAADKYPKTAYSQNFDTWPTNTFTVINNSFSIDHAPSINQPFLLPENNVGTIDWMASSFEYVVERTAELGPPDAPLSQAWRNEAVRLLGGNSYLGLGYIQGNDRQREVIRGLGTASFKARLSQQITPGAYNYNATVHTKHYTASNYLIQAEVKLDSLSPERPSFSLVAYYQSPFKFYEYRLTHVVDPYDIVDIGTLRTPIRDAIIQQDLIRWDNGLPTTLKTSIFTNLATTTGDMLANYVDTYQPQFQLYTAGASVQLRGRFASGLNEISVTDDSSSSSIKSGTFGVMSADCTMEVMSMRMRGTILGPNEDPSSSSQPVNMAETDWAASPLHSLAGSAIRSLVPTNHVQVLTGETINGPWISHGTYALTSFVYANIQAPIELAHSSGGLNSKSVRLQVLGTASHLPSSDVVVDGIEVTSWRGENTVQSGWAVTEGRLVTNAPSGGVNNRISAHLDGTQANLDIPQSVRSPQIMGVGTITFDYRSLTTNKTAIQIQYMTNLQPDDTLFTGWTPLTNIPCNNPDWTTVSIHFGTLAATNVYVRFLNDWYGGGAQSSTHSIIELDNITIWNNPTNSPNDWVAYNTKITNTETNRWWVDGVDGGRNAALNNNVSVDTMPDPQDMADPYIMSPKLLNGFGRLSFLARTYDPTNALVANTEIAVYATKDAWSPLLPDSAWEQVHVFTSITNAFYRPFDLLLTNINDYTMMKLVVEGVRSGLATAQRVCIDEIVVTEQIYAKFDISNVRLMLTDGPVWVATRQPLEGQDIGIEAQLTNMLFEPDDIRMHVTYVIGTNTWGVKQAPLMQQHTLDMDLVDPVNRTYRTRLPSALYSIPEQERNTVVQYLVWAQYASPDTGEMETAQKPDTFVNPEWYFPVDFNKQFEASGWSPYYIVYDVPPGAVWINEVNVYEPSGMTTWQANPYIEIAMPAWMSLGGWSIESLKGAWPDTSATNTIVFPLNVQPKSPYPEANGYAFFVVGPPWQNLPPPITESLPVVDFAVANLNTIMPRLEAGGLRLRRPLGMYEQAIVYDWMEGVGTISGQGWANADSQRRFKYIGYESSDGSLSFTGTVERTESAYVREDSTNTWSGIGLSNWTPGLPNIGQVMPDAPMPGGSNVLITSILSIAKGSHNDDRALTHLIKLRKNESTNIAYQADTWYRLYSIKENDTERLPLAPTNSYTLYVNNVQSNTQVYVTLDAREDAQGLAPDILDWLQGFDDLPFAPTYLNKLDSPQQLTLRECFWINANPTTTNVFTFLAHANDIHLRPLYLTLEMSIFSNLTETVKVTHLQGNSVVQPWASFTLSPVNWDMMLDQYTVTPTSFDMNNKSRVHINAFTNRPAFFKWTLGLEDSRSATHEMENIPKP